MISASEVQSVATAKLRGALPYFSAGDIIRVDRILDRIHVEYIAASASSDSHDATYVQMRFYPAQQLMWIRFLRVASKFRSRGLGRQLTHAAEGVARGLGVVRINVFPLMPARAFWEKAGYEPHRQMTRVLTKQFNAESA